VREQHLGHPGRALRLGVAQPAQLGDRERRDQHAAGHVGAGLGSAHLLDQRRGLGRGPGVVPEQRVAHRRAGRVEADQPVLLAAHRDAVGAPEQAVGRGVHRAQPGPRVDLGAGRVRRRTLPVHGPVVGVHEQRLGGLRRGVDTQDEGHAPI
jgi:hypothetical protein